MARYILFRTLVLAVVVTGSVLIDGCSHSQLVPEWRPWIRSVGDLDDVKPSSYILDVVGESQVSIGDPDLVTMQIEQDVNHWLSRRGFSSSDSDTEYRITFKYRAVSQILMHSDAVMENRSTSAAYITGATNTVPLSSQERSIGVTIATFVGRLLNPFASTIVQSSSPEIQVEYSISLEIDNHAGRKIWQGEAVWLSNGLELLTEILLPMKLLMSELPAEHVVPQVKRVREDKEKAYYNIHCKDRWFSSPAVPYRIKIAMEDDDSPVEQPFAYEAYLDLLESAEISVPVGFESVQDMYSDVSDPNLWKKLLLGGAYRIGSEETPVKILITLEATSSGVYEVASALVASEETYRTYLDLLDEWRSALKEYYNIYEE